MKRIREWELMRINFEAAVNHRGWNMADLTGMDKHKKEDKRHE